MRHLPKRSDPGFMTILCVHDVTTIYIIKVSQYRHDTCGSTEGQKRHVSYACLSVYSLETAFRLVTMPSP